MSPIHLLTGPPADLPASTVACGARDAALGTWDPARVTCAACQRGVCTCGPTVPLCPTCRQWQAQHHGWTQPSRPAMQTEKQFQDAVRQLALANGWLFHHIYNAQKSTAGWVDVVLAKAGHPLLLCELKTDTGRLTMAQEEWGRVLSTITQVTYHLWRPSDWESIVDKLS